MTIVELIGLLNKERGVNLISDDRGRWAVSDSGMQPVPPDGGFTEDVSIVSIVYKENWKPSIQEALEHYFKENPSSD